MQKSLRISVAMIVKNEESDISDCLNSFINEVDEVVVIDTGSTDKTMEIVKNFSDKVIFRESELETFTFSDARNESLRFCKGDWILYIDADERFYHPNLREYLETIADEVGALRVLITGKLQEGIYQNMMYPRVFRNLGYPAISFKRNSHEQISDSIYKAGLKIIDSNIKILHLGYERENNKLKAIRNYRLISEGLYENAYDSYGWYQIAQSLLVLHLYRQAKRAVKMAIYLTSTTDPILASAKSLLSQLYLLEKDWQNGLYWAECSLESVNDQVYAKYLQAYSLKQMGKTKEAAKILKGIEDKTRPMAGFDINLPIEEINKLLN